MNERYEELARDSGMTQYVAANNKYLERFVELLVRECADVAFNNDLQMAIGQWGADSAILKHFGINNERTN